MKRGVGTSYVPRGMLNQKTVSMSALVLETSSEQDSNRSKLSEASQTTLNIRDKTSLFGINLSVFGSTTVAIILLCVVLLGFILIGLVEEGFKFAFPDFSFGWTMTAIELYIFTVFAIVETILKESSGLFFGDANNSNLKRDSNNTRNVDNIDITTHDSSQTMTAMNGINGMNTMNGKELSPHSMNSNDCVINSSETNGCGNETMNIMDNSGNNELDECKDNDNENEMNKILENVIVNNNNNNNSNNNNIINGGNNMTHNDDSCNNNITNNGMNGITGESGNCSTNNNNNNNNNSNNNNNNNIGNENDKSILTLRYSSDEDETMPLKSSRLETIEEGVNFSDLTKDNGMDYMDKINILFSKVFARKVDLKYHFLVAFAMTVSRGLTNMSMLLLNYPTQVIFKSMKLITIMIGSRCFFLKKKYTNWDYLAVPILVGSAICFTLGDSQDALHFNGIGVIVVLISIVFDSCHTNGQEWVLKQNENTHLELLLYSNFFSAILATIMAFVFGELDGLLIFFSNHSFMDVLLWFFVRVLCLYIGVSAFIVFTKRFGAVYAATATTVRKILTVLLSYIFWPGTKQFTSNHLIGSILFGISLACNFQAVNSKSKAKKQLAKASSRQQTIQPNLAPIARHPRQARGTTRVARHYP